MSEKSEWKQEEYYADYDESVSTKFKKLLSNILKYPDNLNVSYTNLVISISTSSVKSLKKAIVRPTLHSDEDQLRIEINKSGFIVCHGYSKESRYTDPNIYNESIDMVMNKVREINADNFNSIWEVISKESGILRDSNLDDILNN
jgi:hypothetical protein